MSTPVFELVYFFIPLPEPLALPDRFVLEVSGVESFEQFVARIDHLGEAATDDDGPRVEMTASLRFWRRTHAGVDVDMFQQLIDVAHKALPDLPKSEEPWPDPPRGHLTVVEVAIPLGAGCTSLPDALDYGIHTVRAIQRAYHLVRRTPVTLMTKQRLPFAIPFAVRRITSDVDQWPAEFDLMLINPRRGPYDAGDDLTESERQRLQEVLYDRPSERVFASYVDLVSHAKNSLDLEGDNRATVLFAAMAAEVLFDDLLAHMLWEEAIRPEDASAVFDKGLQTRVRTQFHSRLGGRGWGLDTAGSLTNWQNHVAALRHRVVHAGYEPMDSEAALSLDALLELEQFIASLLSANRALQAFPRTAMAFLGKDELLRRNMWSAKLERLGNDPSEPKWKPTFERWKLTMQQFRVDPPPGIPSPQLENAVVVAVIHPKGTVRWVLHDRDARKARVAEPPHVMTSEANAAFHRDLQSRVPTLVPLSWAMLGVRARPAKQSSWISEYRLIPMAGVMVNGADLDPIQ